MQTISTLLAEIAGAHKRLADKPIVEPKAELAQNVYPLLQMVVETFATVAIEHEQRVKLAEDAIAETFMQQDSMILPDLAAMLQETLSAVVALIDKVLLVPGLAEDLKKQAHQIRITATELGPVIDDVTVEAVDDDGDGDETEAEDEDDSDADGGRGTAESTKEPHANTAA